jgi:periplasmic protein TonB
MFILMAVLSGHVAAAIALAQISPRQAVIGPQILEVELLQPPAPAPRPELPRAAASKPSPARAARPSRAPTPVAESRMTERTPAAPAAETATAEPALPAPSVAVAAAAPPPIAAAVPPTVLPPRFNADYLRNPAPAYPAMSRRLHEQGKVLLRVIVRADGSPDNVELHRTSGSARLDTAAVEAVRQWRFVPARQGETPVTAAVIVPIVFSLEG